MNCGDAETHFSEMVVSYLMRMGESEVTRMMHRSRIDAHTIKGDTRIA